MSTNNVAVALNVIQTVTNAATNIVATYDTLHEPIISAAQGPQGAPGTTTLNNLTDVDMTNLADGSLLMYDQPSQFWKPKTTLEKQTLECGQY